MFNHRPITKHIDMNKWSSDLETATQRHKTTRIF